jgi:hypothetical protein
VGYVVAGRPSGLLYGEDCYNGSINFSAQQPGESAHLMFRSRLRARMVQGLVGPLRRFLRLTTLHLHGLLYPSRGMVQPFGCPLWGLCCIVGLAIAWTLWQDDRPSIAENCVPHIYDNGPAVENLGVFPGHES